MVNQARGKSRTLAKLGFAKASMIPSALLVSFCLASPSWAEKYSAIVIDAQTNEVLHAEMADDVRYPASLTKMMTLYMLFDAMERGEIKASDKMLVSRHASVQAPTKLGLRRGRTISVEDAIRAICTKSANDAAVVVAERLGGTEAKFAAKMTARARQLGMLNTTFVNASGLPDMRQQTTARDMAMLGERLFQDHPAYYSYFQTPGMRWGRSYAANHNRLLGKVDGVDGIKTGYTNASGYNLASSVSRNGVRLVAVVMGGETASARDAQVSQLIENAYATLDTRKANISVAQLTVNKVGIDAANNMMSSTLTRNDQSGYTVSLPSVAQAIAGAAAAAASVIAPNASAATPSRGAPLASTIVGRSELDSAPGLY